MVTVHDDGMIEFSFYRPEVNKVGLAGDFNNWRTDTLKMERRPDGYWTLRVALPAGEYKFRYVADGMWYTDYAAHGVEPSRFGLDSMLLVPDRAVTFVQPEQAPAAVAAAA